MKRQLFTNLLATLLLAMPAIVGFAQDRTCSTMEILEQQLLQDPDQATRMEAIERHTEDFIHEHAADGSGRVVITIPVVFHIVHNGDALGTNENISDALVLAQLNQLNQDFALTNSDANLIPSIFLPVAANTEIQFCLAQRKPDGTATNGINRINGGQASWTSSQINSNLKPTTIWNRNQYLNIWSVVFGGSSSGLLGYAQFPGGNANTDGIVVLYSSVGSLATPNPQGGNYARGRTATHEVGHWLNLRHIWGDSNCGSDLVNDTPVHNTSNSGCPAHPHFSTCTGSPVEMTMNYMDYTFDGCMYMFTAGQKARMQAVLAVGGSRFSLTTSPGCLPPSSVCGTPAGLSASAITATTATLSWTAVSGALSYNIRWRPVGTTTWSTTTSSSASVGITGLIAGTQYEFQVQVVCSAGTGNFSASTTFTTLTQSCGTPTNLFASSIAGNSAVLNWTGVSGATSYNVRWRIFGTTTWTTGATSSTTLLITGLAPLTQYEFQVQAVCGASTGSFASEFKFTTLTAQGCGTPQNLNATGIEATFATLNWNAVSGATSYNVRWRQLGASTWSTGSTANTSLLVSGLNPRSTYEYQVQAVCGSALGSYSGSASFSTNNSDSTCGIPAGLNATTVTTSTATLNWLSVSGAFSYNVQWRAVGATTWSSSSTGALSLSINGLNAGTQYEFQVQAVCSSSSGLFSASVNFTTATVQSCGTPVGLNATAVTTSAATLNWSAVSGAISYNVQWRAVGTTPWSSGSTGSLSLNISSLSAGTQYEFQVQAVCSSGSGNFSPSANFTTTAQSCGTPANLSATSIAASSAILNWNSVSGATSYNVRWRILGTTPWSNGSTSNTSLPVMGLSAVTQYEFQVQAICGATVGNFADVFNFTTLSSSQSCGTPQGLNATNLGTSFATLNWSAVSGATSYNVQWRQLFSGTAWNTSSTANTSSSISGLTPRTTYEFQVQAVCGGASGGYSNSSYFSTPNASRVIQGSTDAESGFTLFPNPAQTEVTIDVVMEDERPVKVTVTDLTGKIVSVNTHLLHQDQSRATLDVSRLPAGVYVVRVENGKATGVQKLTIVRG